MQTIICIFAYFCFTVLLYVIGARHGLGTLLLYGFKHDVRSFMNAEQTRQNAAFTLNNYYRD